MSQMYIPTTPEQQLSTKFKKISQKKFRLRWNLHKYLTDTDWAPESHRSQLANCLVHCCHGNRICDPTATIYH